MSEATKPRASKTGGLKPGEVVKKPLTVAAAADQFEASTAKAAKLRTELKKEEAKAKEASTVLLAHFDRHGTTSYQKRIAWQWTETKQVLDQGKVKEYLAGKLSQFMKETASKRQVFVLKPAEDAGDEPAEGEPAGD